MESLGIRIAYSVAEAVVVGLALGGLIVLVRRIQIAFGVKDDTADKPVPVSGAR